MFKKPSLPIPDCFLLKMRPSTDGGKDFLRRGMIAQRVLFDATSYFLRAAPWREERSSTQPFRRRSFINSKPVIAGSSWRCPT